MIKPHTVTMCVKHVIYMCIYVHIIKTGEYMTGMVSSDEDCRNFEILSFYLFSRDHTNFTVLKKQKFSCQWYTNTHCLPSGFPRELDN